MKRALIPLLLLIAGCASPSPIRRPSWSDIVSDIEGTLWPSHQATVNNCKVCRALGRRSILGHPGKVTMKKFPEEHRMFYDEEGRVHLHDSSVTEITWRCSEGHKYTERTVTYCPWGDD